MAVSRVIDRVGQVLGGRYRLLAPIGTGASASVYLADDAVLRRRVAVKVLHAALADDEAFLRRFRAEARAAAALNHPNIMAVYDWGQDPDVPYLVTEYLGGGSLRALLNQSGPLTPAQALMVGLEAARGLEYAHRRGFVHRDIKPANLLFDEDARLRIADFGLARALAEATWTEPVGAVLGTAKYASPEQARGESLDGRSDVYSLALVVIEAVTGRVPFAADTTIGTLMARVDRDTPVPDELGALAGPLRWAGAADPARRPDAAELGAALMAAASAYDRPAPLALAGARLPDDVVVIDLDPTERVPRPGEAPAPTGDPAPGGPGGPGMAAVAGLAGVAGAVTGAAGAAGFAGLAATPPVAPLGVGGPTVPGGVPGPAPVADLVPRADPDGADATPPADPGSAGPPVPGGADAATDPAVDAAGGVGPVGFAPVGGAVPVPGAGPRPWGNGGAVPEGADAYGTAGTEPGSGPAFAPASSGDGPIDPAGLDDLDDLPLDDPDRWDVGPDEDIDESEPAWAHDDASFDDGAFDDGAFDGYVDDHDADADLAAGGDEDDLEIDVDSSYENPPVRAAAAAGQRWRHMLPFTASAPITDAAPVDDAGPSLVPDHPVDPEGPDRRAAGAAALAAGSAVAVGASAGSGFGGAAGLDTGTPTLEVPAADAVTLDGPGAPGGLEAPDQLEPGTRRERRAQAQVAKAQHRAARVSQQAAGRRRRRWPSVLLVIVLLAGVAGGGYAYWYNAVRIPTYPMLELTGKNVTELDALVAANQWTIERTERFDDTAPVGRVLDQQPAVGTPVARGATVSVVVSKGPPPVNVPTDLAGLPLDQARARLQAVGLGADPVTKRFDEDVPLDAVISVADGTPSIVLKGSDVGLVVSSGPEPRTIPDGLVGRPGDQAAVALKKLDLDLTTTEAFSDTVAKGNVISVKPGSGEQVPRGSTVAIVVSKGPETVPVPDVVGLSVVDAAKAIEAAGLTVSGTSGSPTKKVTASSPAAGTVVKKGSSVELSTDAKDAPGTSTTTAKP